MATCKAGLRAILVITFCAPVQSHRDHEGMSNSKLEVDAERKKNSMNLTDSLSLTANLTTLEEQLKALKTACSTDIHEYSNDEEGIEALKQCVKELEQYGDKVRDNEKQAMAAHGTYRRAFIQTYGLLQSALDEKQQLNRFEATFRKNHTDAADYMKGKLAELKALIGNSWNASDTSPSMVQIAETSQHAAPQHVPQAAETNVRSRVNGTSAHTGSLIELNTDGHMKKTNSTWHPPLAYASGRSSNSMAQLAESSQVSQHVPQGAGMNVRTRVNGSSAHTEPENGSLIELKTDGRLKKTNATWHPPLVY